MREIPSEICGPASAETSSFRISTASPRRTLPRNKAAAISPRSKPSHPFINCSLIRLIWGAGTVDKYRDHNPDGNKGVNNYGVLLGSICILTLSLISSCCVPTIRITCFLLGISILYPHTLCLHWRATLNCISTPRRLSSPRTDIIQQKQIYKFFCSKLFHVVHPAQGDWQNIRKLTI